MTQILDLDRVTPDPDNSVPTDGPGGPGRVLLSEIAASGVTLQGAYNNGSVVTVGSPGPVTISATDLAGRALRVTKSGGSGSIADFSSSYAGARVQISSLDGSLTVLGDGITTSASRLELGAGGVPRVAVEGDQLRVPEGTAAAPGLAGDGATGTGVRCASAVLGLSVGGAECAQVTAAGVMSKARLGWVDDPNTHLTATGDVITATAGGDAIVDVDIGGVNPSADLAASLGSFERRFAVSWQGEKVVAGNGTHYVNVAHEVTIVDISSNDTGEWLLWSFDVPLNHTILVEATVIGINAADGKTHYAAKRVGSMGVNGSGSVILSDVADVFSHNLVSTPITIDNDGTTIRVETTGIAVTTIHWTGTVRYQLVRIP